MVAAARPRRRVLVGLGSATLLLAGVIGLLVMRSVPWIDQEWMTEVLAVRGPAGTSVASVFNALGGGVLGVVVVPVVGTLALWRWRGRWAAVFFLVASAASALVVQGLKAAFGRVRPEDILVAVDSGSFPSGHTANAATITVVLGIVAQRWWVWLTGVLYTVAMA
ncbi:MAG: phosphatase PAP2 family protein, partial [Propionicimonas sp.]|nr:phosphatase PAP2 family protein [Propionicimonas sp.]